MLSSGAYRLLDLIRWFHRKFGACFPKQTYIAARLKTSIGSVKRWLSELVRNSYVLTERHGRRGSTYILSTEPSTACEKTVQGELDFEPDSTSVSIVTEYSELTTTTASFSSDVQNEPRKGPQRSSMARFQMPQPTTTNALGRTDPNPDFAQVQEVLRGASWRIQRARNPVAYERAILCREFPHLVRRAG